MKAIKVFVLSKKGKVMSLPFKPTEFFDLDISKLPHDCLVLGEDGKYSSLTGHVLTRDTAYLASHAEFQIYAELTAWKS